ncbi:MAG: response regulator transcription factor [Clostridium sp.]
MKKIVIIEDELFMREEIQYILDGEGYETQCITDFSSCVDQVLLSSPDLVLLDLNLPGITGFEICKGIRRKSNIPIFVLTGRDQMRDELHALDIGADEYINKPCHKDRLLVRIANLLRRAEDRKNIIEIKGISLDTQTYKINCRGKVIVLPENQGKIMEILIENYQDVVTKEMLLKKIWETTEFIDENALHVNMTRVKKTLKSLDTSYKINTIRGIGYSLISQGECNV